MTEVSNQTTEVVATAASPVATLESSLPTEDYPAESSQAPSSARKRPAPKSNLHLLVAQKRPKPDPRPPFKHVTNALREEIVRDHLISERGQAGTVALWKERFPELSLTQSSLSRWIKNAQYIQLANANGGSASARSHTKHRVAHPEIDGEVAQYVFELQEAGERVTSDMVRHRYMTLCDERDIPASSRPKLSTGWVDSFKRRHNVNIQNCLKAPGDPGPASPSQSRRRDGSASVDYTSMDHHGHHQHHHHHAAEMSLPASSDHFDENRLATLEDGLSGRIVVGDQETDQAGHFMGFLSGNASSHAAAATSAGQDMSAIQSDLDHEKSDEEEPAHRIIREVLERQQEERQTRTTKSHQKAGETGMEEPNESLVGRVVRDDPPPDDMDIHNDGEYVVDPSLEASLE